MFRILGIPASKWTMVILAGDIGAFLVTVSALILMAPLMPALLPLFPKEFFPALLVLLGLQLLALYVADLYDYYQDYRTGENISRLIFMVWMALLLALLFLTLSPKTYLNRSFLEWQAMLFAALLVLWRYTFSALALPMRLRRRALIIGTDQGGRLILEAIRAHPQSGLEAVGVIVEEPSATLTEVEGVPVLGEPEQLEKIVKQNNVDMVVMATPPDRSHRLLPQLSRLSFNSLQIIDMPSLYEHLCGKIPAQYISEVWVYMHSVYQHKTYYLRCKRLIDLAGASVGLILTLPLLLLAALAIKLDSRGPVLFRQLRLGQDKKLFYILKLRTMIHENHSGLLRWVIHQDPRVTRAGWVLRRLRLDELPQLINVIKGEMSLIGPRAEWEVFAQDALQPAVRWQPGRRATDPPGTLVPCGQQEEIPFYGFRTVVRPGITGWAQVMNPLAGSSPQELTEKLQYDLYYIKNMGFFLDLIILLKTLRVVLIGRGK